MPDMRMSQQEPPSSQTFPLGAKTVTIKNVGLFESACRVTGVNTMTYSPQKGRRQALIYTATIEQGEEYKRYVETDPILSRRYTDIIVELPNALSGEYIQLGRL
jgi:hypothetical protein